MIFKTELEHLFTEGQSFYLYHHIEVLGTERGVHQVASRLNKTPQNVLKHYRLLKAKARHIAV